MKPSRRVIVSLGAAAALAHCSSTPPPSPAPPPAHVAAAPMVQAEDAPPDLSPVPAPDGLMVTLRVASPRRLAERMGALLGMGDGMVHSLESSLPAIFGDDEALAHVIDLTAPVDLVLYKPAGGGAPVAVVSFSTASMGRAENALADGHRLTPGAGGARRIEATAPGREGGAECALAPAFGPNAARLVCAEHYTQMGPVLPYLARTLPRTPVDPSAGELVAEVAVVQARESLLGDARSTGDDLVRALTPQPDPNNPQYQDSVRAWARDMAASLPLALNDLGSARLTLSLPPAGADIVLDVGLQGTSAPLVRQIVEATRDAHAPADRTGHLPGDGFGYLAAALGLEPFRATLNVASGVAAAALVPHGHLPPADNTALRTAIAALFAQDRVSTATTLGGDAQGRPWLASEFQVTTPPAQFVANVRALVAVMKRPAVARAITADQHSDVARWTVMPPGPGIPAGAYLLRIPPESAHPSNTSPGPGRPPPGLRPSAGGHPTPAAAPRVPTELLLVPEGASVWFFMGTDARALYRATQAAHPAGVTAAALGGDGVAAAVGLVPAASAPLFHDDPEMSRLLPRLMREAEDHGTTPATLAFSNVQRDGQTHLGLRLQVPLSVLRMIGATVLGIRLPHP